MFEICSILATRTPEQRLVLVCLLLILEQISHIVLVLTLLTLKKQMLTELCDTWGGFFIFDDCILFPLFVSFRINNTDYHQEKLL